MRRIVVQNMHLDQKALERLNEIGIALSKEHHIPALLEKILLHAKELLKVDAGTVYRVVDQTLHFEMAVSDSLGLRFGGTSNIPVPFLDLPLLLPNGLPNDRLMVAYSVNHKKTINIKDPYVEEGFDFSGTKQFDLNTGYRTKAVLTTPIKTHENRVIAVLQLINPIDQDFFSDEDVRFAESLASQAGVALTNELLITSLKNLFESLIRVIAEAVDEKSPSTGNHSKRVPILAQLLAESVDQIQEGCFKDVHFSKEEIYELKIAAFLHDCGKITTPVHIAEKKNKLEGIFDRIELISTRFTALCHKTEKENLLKKLHWFESHYPKEFAIARDEFLLIDKKSIEQISQYEAEKEWIQKINSGGLSVTKEVTERLRQIALYSFDGNQPMITPEELEHLLVTQGNLTEKEKDIIKNHVVMTYRMLSQLEFPQNLKRVPEIAASHHERVDGKGYPLGLIKDQMSLQARILVIADIFEALSAPDRPYRKAQPLSQVLKLMQGMVEDGHIDSELFEIFIKQKAYLPYAKQYLTPEQIDI